MGVSGNFEWVVGFLLISAGTSDVVLGQGSCSHADKDNKVCLHFLFGFFAKYFILFALVIFCFLCVFVVILFFFFVFFFWWNVKWHAWITDCGNCCECGFLKASSDLIFPLRFVCIHCTKCVRNKKKNDFCGLLKTTFPSLQHIFNNLRSRRLREVSPDTLNCLYISFRSVAMTERVKHLK